VFGTDNLVRTRRTRLLRLLDEATPMLVFFRCIAEAIAEKGVRGLAGMVPGGPYACDVAGAV
jgi:hypothetical protein